MPSRSGEVGHVTSAPAQAEGEEGHFMYQQEVKPEWNPKKADTHSTVFEVS